MFLVIMILALVMFIAGGVGLFFTNIEGQAGSLIWIQGNITFGAFVVVGLIMIIVLAMFSSQIE